MNHEFFSTLRANASLQTVAKQTARASRHAHKRWLDLHAAMQNARNEGREVTPQTMSRLTELGQVYDQAHALATHLNRLAKTTFPTIHTTKQ